MQSLTENMKYYAYYLEAYTAVLGGMVGAYEIEEPVEDGSVSWVTKYGLKAFSPIAKNFPYRIMTISVYHAVMATGVSIWDTI